jgi:hypothetical protein
MMSARNSVAICPPLANGVLWSFTDKSHESRESNCFEKMRSSSNQVFISLCFGRVTCEGSLMTRCGLVAENMTTNCGWRLE